MKSEFADRLMRPEIVESVKSFMSADTNVERSILFPTVQAVIGDALTDGVCAEIIYHQLLTALEYVKIINDINIAAMLPEITKLLDLIFIPPANTPNPQKNRNLAKQTIVFVTKMDIKFKNK